MLKSILNLFICLIVCSSLGLLSSGVTSPTSVISEYFRKLPDAETLKEHIEDCACDPFFVDSDTGETLFFACKDAEQVACIIDQGMRYETNHLGWTDNNKVSPLAHHLKNNGLKYDIIEALIVGHKKTGVPLGTVDLNGVDCSIVRYAVSIFDKTLIQILEFYYPGDFHHVDPDGKTALQILGSEK